MGHLNKRARQLRDARETKRQRRSQPEETDRGPSEFEDILHEAHWEGLSDEDEEGDIDISEPEDNISDEGRNAFEILLKNARSEGCDAAETTEFRYQRGPTLSKRQQRRIRETGRQLAHAANTQSQPLNRFFSPISALPPLNNAQTSATESQCQLRQKATQDLEKKLHSKKKMSWWGRI